MVRPAAFRGLDVAVTRFTPVDPCRCLIVAPVFALNYAAPAPQSLPALNGLNVAVTRFTPTDPHLTVSPVFFGLRVSTSPGSVDSPVV
jgi:hypothetical protein